MEVIYEYHEMPKVHQGKGIDMKWKLQKTFIVLKLSLLLCSFQAFNIQNLKWPRWNYSFVHAFLAIIVGWPFSNKGYNFIKFFTVNVEYVPF
jgi:hypothetical protein